MSRDVLNIVRRLAASCPTYSYHNTVLTRESSKAVTMPISSSQLHFPSLSFHRALDHHPTYALVIPTLLIHLASRASIDAVELSPQRPARLVA